MQRQHIYEIIGADGRTHSVRAPSDRRAVEEGRKWGDRHGGLAAINRLEPHGWRRGWWDRADRRPVKSN